MPIASLGVDDFGQSGDVEDLYRHFGIDADTIVGAALDLIWMARPDAPSIDDAAPVRLDGGRHDPDWLKATGERVERGEELVEIETDKVTMAHESPAAGVMTIVAQAVQPLPVGGLIQTLGARSEPTPHRDANRSRQPNPSSRPSQPDQPNLSPGATASHQRSPNPKRPRWP